MDTHTLYKYLKQIEAENEALTTRLAAADRLAEAVAAYRLAYNRLANSETGSWEWDQAGGKLEHAEVILVRSLSAYTATKGGE